MARGYQLNYSQLAPQKMFDTASRRQKADTIVAVSTEFAGPVLPNLRVLDVGASTGIIDAFLAEHFGEVVGLDIDTGAIQSAQATFLRPHLRFLHGDAMALPFAASEFDVVICTQVYEHVPDAQVVMAEIYRVLKPGGFCYFAAGNRFNFQEAHYGLPLLSVLPRPLADLYVRASGKAATYYEKHLSVWGLRRLVAPFILHDFTTPIILDPARYHAEAMLPPQSLQQRVASLIATQAYWLCPGYIWLLEKPATKKT